MLKIWGRKVLQKTFAGKRVEGRREKRTNLELQALNMAWPKHCELTGWGMYGKCITNVNKTGYDKNSGRSKKTAKTKREMGEPERGRSENI